MPATARHLAPTGIDEDRPKQMTFRRYPIGFFHIDVAWVQTAEGKLCLFAVTQRVEKAD